MCQSGPRPSGNKKPAIGATTPAGTIVNQEIDMPTLAIRDQLRNLRLQNRKLACRGQRYRFPAQT